jgi:hypothetical protein
MVGDRYGQSLDVGKEIEKEKEEEKQPLPCVCTPKIKPKEEFSESPSEKQEEKRPEQPTEPEEKQPPQEEKPVEQEPEKISEATVESSAQKLIEEAKEEPPEKVPDDEPEEAPAEPRVPDPAEEDVNEIITKDFPVLRQRTSVWETFFSHSWIFWVVLFVVVGGMFWAWTSVTREERSEPVGNVILPADNTFSFNATYEELVFPEQNITLQENIKPVPETAVAEDVAQENITPVPETAPVEDTVQEKTDNSTDELSKLLAEGLKD